MDLQAFWNVATPTTLASLISDIDACDYESEYSDLRTLAMTQLVSIVGEEEAIDLISAADARR